MPSHTIMIHIDFISKNRGKRALGFVKGDAYGVRIFGSSTWDSPTKKICNTTKQGTRNLPASSTATDTDGSEDNLAAKTKPDV